MATTNQIELAKLRETTRHNKATEGIDLQKLNETVRNNNLTHSVNVTKNEITKLANDQLNSRQLKELAEKMTLEYDKLNEEAYNNDLQVWLKERLANLDAALQGDKNEVQLTSSLISMFGSIVGASVRGALTGALAPSATKKIASYVVQNPESGYAILAGNMPYELYTQLALDDPRYFKDKEGGSMTPSEVEQKRQDDEKANSNLGQMFRDQYNEAKTKTAESVANTKGKKMDNSDRPSRNSYYSRREKFEDRNEIPMDSSSSKGPDKSNQQEFNNDSYIVPNVNSDYNHGYTSGGTDYTVSGGYHSAATIVQPSINGNNRN